MTIQQAILYGEEALQEKGVDQARWNSERLLLLALQQPRSKVYSDLKRELSDQELSRFIALIERRATHYPLAYLEGTQEFFGREFHVNESVLIPRPETEEIIQAVKSLQLKERPVFLDLGSGSGNIPVTLALEIKDSFAVGLELSEKAIPVLRQNQRGNVQIVRGDFTVLCFRPATFEVITVNLPYVETQEYGELPPETLWEPKIALHVESLEESYGKVMQQSLAVLKPGGYLVMEIGFGQSERLQKLVDSFPEFTVQEIRKDQRGIPRVLVLQKVIFPNKPITSS
ncbi:peptide chain release factor N(5)-glutamine methyltransferase [bacterium]|nr:peptide chain release factor N(5)-glutamine methyltransferase [bacterium]MCI0605056.1 peptide chain release factor N(5)-glutamine methyltransferase [bacterium]